MDASTEFESVTPSFLSADENETEIAKKSSIKVWNKLMTIVCPNRLERGIEKLKPIKSSRFLQGQSPHLGVCMVIRYTVRVKIYIVDDASFIRMICRYHLSKAGHEIVGESHDGETALTEILAIQPECVVVDLSLPSKNGAEIMKDVQAKYPNIQFIVVTALDKDIMALTAPDVGYAAYIRKPFEGAELVNAVASLQAAPVGRKYG